MRIFISWSGDPAKLIASAARTFFATVLAGRVVPFMSEHDIEKGARFGGVLSEELGATDTGLLILTSKNQDAPWLVFEAGALSKSLTQSRVVPLVVDIEHAAQRSPVGQFQDASISDVDAMWAVVAEINSRLFEPNPEAVMRILFDASWDALQVAVQEAREALAQPEPKVTANDILAEILDGVRGISAQQRRLTTRVAALEETATPKPATPARLASRSGSSGSVTGLTALQLLNDETIKKLNLDTTAALSESLRKFVAGYNASTAAATQRALQDLAQGAVDPPKKRAPRRSTQAESEAAENDERGADTAEES